MGLFKLLSRAFGKKKKSCKVVVVGLDNSGKTTLINHLKPKKVREAVGAGLVSGALNLPFASPLPLKWCPQ